MKACAAKQNITLASKKPMPFLALLYGFRKFVGVPGECASRSLLKAEGGYRRVRKQIIVKSGGKKMMFEDLLGKINLSIAISENADKERLSSLEQEYIKGFIFGMNHVKNYIDEITKSEVKE
jgi:hypothetical protein